MMNRHLVASQLGKTEALRFPGFGIDSLQEVIHSQQLYSLVEGQINADGIHTWPFRPGFPVDHLTVTCCGPNVRMNRHEYCELIYVTSGAARFELQDRTYDLNSGDLIVIGPSLYHRLCVDSGHRVRLSLLFFHPEILNGPSTAESVEYLMPFFQQSTEFPVVVPGSTGLPQKIAGCMKRIRDEMPGAGTRSRLTAKTYLKLALVTLLNHYAELLDTREAFHDREAAIARLEPVFDLLEFNFTRHVGVSEAARCCAMSSSHFMCFFKRVTGQSFINYANQFRIAKAQEMLRTSGRSISDISQDTGFCDQSHFGSTFRKMVGLTPREYRQKFSSGGATDLPRVDVRHLVH